MDFVVYHHLFSFNLSVAQVISNRPDSCVVYLIIYRQFPRRPPVSSDRRCSSRDRYILLPISSSNSC